MKKINWKVRQHNIVFIMAAVSAFLLFVKALLDLLGVVLPFDIEELESVIELFLLFLVAIGVVADVTTPGVGDTDRAMEYVRPGKTNSEL